MKSSEQRQSIASEPTAKAQTLSRAEPPIKEPRAAHLGHEGTERAEHRAFWLWVMCLTGVDYFSTLAYQPSIAFAGAGLLAPLATVVLVLVPLFAALPVYAHVAARPPNGQGSMARLERLVRGWKGKIAVLALLGFAATDFVITKTLSAADAAVHLLDNPLWEHVPAFIRTMPIDQQRVWLTMMLLIVLGATFLRSFKEAIGVAMVVVACYLALNLIVVGSGLAYLVMHPGLFDEWLAHLGDGNWHLDNAPLAGRD